MAPINAFAQKDTKVGIVSLTPTIALLVSKNYYFHFNRMRYVINTRVYNSQFPVKMVALAWTVSATILASAWTVSAGNIAKSTWTNVYRNRVKMVLYVKNT